MLNPMDFLLWLSEELETRDWDSGIVGTQLGFGLNLLYLIVRANSTPRQAKDDLFGDDSATSWLSMLVCRPPPFLPKGTLTSLGISFVMGTSSVVPHKRCICLFPNEKVPPFRSKH